MGGGSQMFVKYDLEEGGEVEKCFLHNNYNGHDVQRNGELSGTCGFVAIQ
jgi:hypothetical protein